MYENCPRLAQKSPWRPVSMPLGFNGNILLSKHDKGNTTMPYGIIHYVHQVMLSIKMMLL